MSLNQPAETSRTLRKRLGIVLVVFGAVTFYLGAAPEWFDLDRSPVIGFVQIGVFTFGLGLIALGGYFTIDSLWNGKQKSIAAEIGERILGTGYVVALASGMADVFGLGTRPLPATPFFGFWQVRGVLVGQIMMLVGLTMMLPFWRGLVANLRRRRTNGNIARKKAAK
jgi:hypothetical protein